MPQEACGVQVREAALASHAGVRSQRVQIKAEKGSWGEEREESLSFLEIFGFCCSLESADVDDSFASCKRRLSSVRVCSKELGKLFLMRCSSI